MSKQVWKFQLNGYGSVSLPVPAAGKVVEVAEQDGLLCMWVEVDPAAVTVLRTFEVFGTGHAVPDAAQYLGTVHVPLAGLVLHVYETTPDPF